ncbi:MAG: hypothetical protein U0359_18330 [Byssovorax sp.]
MTTLRPARLPILLLGALSAAACNSVTGVDDLVLEADAPTSGGHGGGATTGGAGGSTGTTTSSGTTSSGMPAPPQETMVPADGVTITKISLYQGVERKLMEKGAAASSKTPIIAGRDALVRVFFSLDAKYDKGAVTARLTIDKGAPIEVKKTLSGTSKDGTLGSTINFEIPKERMAGGDAYRVELLQSSTTSSGDNKAAVFPASGTAALDVQSVGPALKIKLVPVAYNADGSGRKPDTSATQKKAYVDAFYAFYPITGLDLSVHSTLAWNQSVDANGNGWGELLDAIAQLRAKDGAPADTYYYGIFSPAGSANQYCSQGCVAGLGMVATSQDSYSHAAIGLGFSGDIATETAVHEIGHTHGRNHAPCGGAQGVDSQYPYSGASIGTWGYNLLDKQLYSPSGTTDLMGYCSPIWISDYNFTALFKRIKLVNNAEIVYAPELLDQTYERVRIDARGNATWLDPIELHTPPSSEEVTLTVHTAQGSFLRKGQLYRYDHLDGGILMWPRDDQALAADLDLDSRAIHMTR